MMEDHHNVAVRVSVDVKGGGAQDGGIKNVRRFLTVGEATSSSETPPVFHPRKTDHGLNVWTWFSCCFMVQPGFQARSGVTGLPPPREEVA